MSTPRPLFSGSAAQVVHPLVGALAGAVVGVALLAVTSDKLTLPILLAVVLAGGASLVWFKGSLRQYFLNLLFFVAPYDLSKAIVPPFGQYYAPGLYLSISHVVMICLGLSWLHERLLVLRVPLQRTRLDTLSLIYVIWIWISALNTPGDKMLLGASAMSYSLSVLGFYIVSHAVYSAQEVRNILKLVALGLLLQALHVAAQMATHSYLPLPGSKISGFGAVINFGGQEAAAFRPVGAFDHPNALADYLTLVTIPAFAFALMGLQRLPRRTWYAALVATGVGSALLLITLSRGAWAAFILGCLSVGAIYWRKRLIGSTHLVAAILAGVVALAGVIAVYPQIIYRLTEPDDRSTESRVVLNDQALAIIQHYPLTGAGFGGYNRAATQIQGPRWGTISSDYQEMLLHLVVHNHYLLVAAQMGIPALLYWCYLLWSFARQAWPLTRWQDAGSFALGVGLTGAIISQMLFLASDNYDADIRVMLLWLTVGLLQALTRLYPAPSGARA